MWCKDNRCCHYSKQINECIRMGEDAENKDKMSICWMAEREYLHRILKETIVQENLLDAIEVCDSMVNCVECSKYYRGFDDDKGLIPCNFIRLNYGVSIWDYKMNKIGENK